MGEGLDRTRRWGVDRRPVAGLRGQRAAARPASRGGPLAGPGPPATGSANLPTGRFCSGRGGRSSAVGSETRRRRSLTWPPRLPRRVTGCPAPRRRIGTAAPPKQTRAASGSPPSRQPRHTSDWGAPATPWPGRPARPVWPGRGRRSGRPSSGTSPDPSSAREHPVLGPELAVELPALRPLRPPLPREVRREVDRRGLKGKCAHPAAPVLEAGSKGNEDDDQGWESPEGG